MCDMPHVGPNLLHAQEDVQRIFPSGYSSVHKISREVST